MDPEEIEQLSPAEAPLVMSMMQHIPGISASLGFAAFRGSNTIMRGGFMDDSMRARRTAKYSAFARDSLSPAAPVSSSYYGTAARRTRLARSVGTDKAKMALGKGGRVNHLTGRPRALSRYHSLSIFNASDKSGMYSPFQVAYRGAGRLALRSGAFTSAIGMSDEAIKTAKGGDVFQRGMISMITAGRRIDLLEAKAAGGSSRAAAKVAKAQTQVTRLAMMNNPGLGVSMGSITSTEIVSSAQRLSGTGALAGSNRVGMRGRAVDRIAEARAAAVNQARTTSAVTAGSFIDDTFKGGIQIGATGNLMASAGATAGSRYLQGYFRGALGFADAPGLRGEALKGARMAVSHLDLALEKIGKAGPGLAQKALGEGVIKTLGYTNTFKALGTKTGALSLGARAGAMAIPGLNLIATASLVYDLAKMGGEVIKSGINLAKDGVKSIKGSIDKPMFGMGYKDNEVAATSRARGVMAIQNSRLNARSLLGSEASMMAAHFG